MPIEWSIETHDSVKSTQEILKGMAGLEEPEGKVIHAYEQKGGTGRHGRPWISEKGNLYTSILLRPDCPAQKVTQLSLLTALAVADTIQTYMISPEKLVLKWPNDVLIDGEKCAGILLETELHQSGAVKWVVIGVGINVHKPPLGMGVGVQDYSEQIIDLINFRNVYLRNMARYYTLWNREDFSLIRHRWLDKAHKEGTRIQVKIGAQIERGFFHDLDAAGNMIIRDNEYRTKTISAGEVHFLDRTM